jgi:transposase
MRAVPLPEPDPVVAAAIRKKYAGRRAPLAVMMRDRLGEWMTDELFASAFGARGRPGQPPARLAMVTVLQMAEDLTDRQAAEAVRTRLDWQYALGLPLDDDGFDHTVLSEFRGRVAGHGLEEAALDALLARLSAEGLVRAGGKQRTDSAHVIAAVRALHTVELAGESVRAALEALAAACPDWLTARFCTADWTRRYGARIDSWRLPAGKKERDKLIIEYARDGYALAGACYEDTAPPWARELPAVQVLRTVLVQNFTVTAGGQGREVIRRREPESAGGDGVPPARIKVASPYDTEARWGAKKDTLWLGWKLHVTETCDDPPGCGCTPGPGTAPGGCPCDVRPNLVTNVATTDATVPDAAMTVPLSTALAGKGLAPARHYADSGYASALSMAEAARISGTILVTPLMSDTSRQAREKKGYDRSAFAVDYDARTATCPQGQASTGWFPARQRGSLPPLPGARALHHRRPQGPAAHHPAPRPARPAGSRPRRAGRQALAGRLQTPRRHRGRHQPGHRTHRMPPRPLPRPAQDPPRARLPGRRPQPLPPGRLLERHAHRPQAHHPPGPPRPQPPPRSLTTE